MVDTIYNSLRGDQCFEEVVGPNRVGMWKCIKTDWEGFSKFVSYEVGEDLQCGFGLVYGVGSSL